MRGQSLLKPARPPSAARRALPGSPAVWLLLAGLAAVAAAWAGPPPAPGPFLGTFTLKEKPLPLAKPGTVRALPPPEARLQAVARLGAGFQEGALAPYGWRVVSEHLGFATLEGDPATAPALEADAGAVPGLLAFRPSRAGTGSMAAARRLSHVDEVLSWGSAPNPAGVSGKGVLVGIIDFGFDTRHPAFLDSAGRLRFLAIWDPNRPAKPGAPFNRGEMRRTEELVADPAFGTNPEDMHGTHVAAVAAGSDAESPYHGVAPEASLLGVNLSTRNDSVSVESNVMRGIQWMFRVADSLGLPCVVNLSLGNQHRGPHDGTSTFDRFIDTVTGPGRIVVGAAGNDGSKRLHARIPLSTDTVGTWTPVPAYADVWGEAGKAFRYQVLLRDSATGAYMAQTAFLSTSTGRGRMLVDSVDWTEPGTGRKIPLYVIVRPENAAPENGKPRVEVRVEPASKDTALQPRGLLAGVRFLGTGNLHAWNVYSDSFRVAGTAGWVGGDNDLSLSELGGTAKEMISVGAWVSTNSFQDYLGNGRTSDVLQDVGEAAVWSGRGPAADGRVKPDISAPGCAVIAAFSRSVEKPSPWMAGRIVTWPDPGTFLGRYLAAEGTSQATPFVSGVVALLLEAQGDLAPAQVREVLAQTARKDAFTGPLASPSPVWGPGKVDAAAAVRRLRQVPVGALAARAAPGIPRARFVGGLLRLEGPGAAEVRGVNLHDTRGRLVAAFVRRADGRFSLPGAAPRPGLYVATLRMSRGTARLRLLVP